MTHTRDPIARTPSKAVPDARPFIVPVFLSHAGCPHRCVFCDQGNITGVRNADLTSNTLRRTVRRVLAYRRPERSPCQISFYGGNFLGLTSKSMQRMLREAQRFVRSGRIDGIRFSTRPDTVTQERLDALGPFSVSTVEIGAQSMIDAVLIRARRGHTARATEQAVALLKSRGYETGLQTMVGLPGETEESAMASARRMAELAPDFVRIYPTVVLRNSRLAEWYEAGRYTPLSLTRSVSLVRTIYQLFTEKGIPVVRMGLQPSKDLDSGDNVLAGPYHPAFGHLVYSEIFLEKAISLLGAQKRIPANVCFYVHPASVSRLRGLKNGNIATLRRRFGLTGIRVRPDAALARDDLAVESFA